MIAMAENPSLCGSSEQRVDSSASDAAMAVWKCHKNTFVAAKDEHVYQMRIKKLEQQLADARNMNNLNQLKLKGFQMEINQLRQSTEDLSEENDELINDMQDMIEENTELKTTLSDVVKEKNRLRLQVKALVDIREKHEDQLEKQRDVILMEREERTRLKDEIVLLKNRENHAEDSPPVEIESIEASKDKDSAELCKDSSPAVKSNSKEDVLRIHPSIGDRVRKAIGSKRASIDVCSSFMSDRPVGEGHSSDTECKSSEFVVDFPANGRLRRNSISNCTA